MQPSVEILDAIDTFMQHLGVLLTEANRPLYHQALTHSSYTYEFKNSNLDNYERLEFLGDAVLKLVVSNYLFLNYPHYREGEMTKIRSVLVSDAMLAEFARELALEKLMILGPAEARNHGRKKVSNLACAFEALLGALYLDAQWDVAERMILTLVENRLLKRPQATLIQSKQIPRIFNRSHLTITNRFIGLEIMEIIKLATNGLSRFL